MKTREAPVLRLLAFLWALFWALDVAFYSHVFEKLFYLWVVLRFNRVLADEILFLALMVVILESVVIQIVVKLMASDIVDCGRQIDHWPGVAFGLSDGYRRVGGAIFSRCVEGKRSLHIVRNIGCCYLRLFTYERVLRGTMDRGCCHFDIKEAGPRKVNSHGRGL